MYSINNINSISVRIPRDIRDQLSPFHYLIIDYIVHLMKCTHRRSPSGAYYAFPSQLTIANHFGYTRTYVSECISQIVALGLLIKIRRRRVGGRWQTNLYKVGRTLASALMIASAFVSSVLHHVELKNHIVNKPSISISTIMNKSLLGLKAPPKVTEVMDYILDLGRKLQFRSKT